MNEIDEFSIQLFEQAKRFLEKAKEEKSTEGKRAYLHASLLLGVSSLEAHVNSLADEFLSTYSNLDILERSILSEKDIGFENGSFGLTDRLKMYRLIERLEFIFQRFGVKKLLDKKENWWGQLIEALRIRNELVHPKQSIVLDEEIVRRALQAILEALNAMFRSVFNSNHPIYGRRLDSDLMF